MIEIQEIVNEKTGERRLYYRYEILGLNASGALEPCGKKSEWIRVTKKTLDEASLDDLVESGGIFQ